MWPTRFRRGSCSSSSFTLFAGEDGSEGIGVVASCSNGSGLFLGRRFLVSDCACTGGDGGGLGGRCRL